MTLHKQVVTSRGIEVDEELAAMLESMWASGIETQFSCQNADYSGWGFQPSLYGKFAHIAFPTVDDAMRFVGMTTTMAAEQWSVMVESGHKSELRVSPCQITKNSPLPRANVRILRRDLRWIDQLWRGSAR